MAESGTDQAAAAFQADMNPSSTPAQPRNERGEFSKIAPPVRRLLKGRGSGGNENYRAPEQANQRGREDLPKSNVKGSAESEGKREIRRTKSVGRQRSDENQALLRVKNVKRCSAAGIPQEALGSMFAQITFHQR